jgi:ELWxxDGT repeat protein
MNASSQYSLISDLWTGIDSSQPDDLYIFNNKVYFTAIDINGNLETWSYDGINPPLIPFDVNTSGGTGYSNFAEIDGILYFSGYNGVTGNEVYTYDGVNPPTRISDICPGGCNSIPAEFTKFNGKIYFRANGPGNDFELYEYDGVNPPTMVMNINPSGNSYPYSLKVFNNKLYFGANDGVNGNELWVYDGINTPSMVADINPLNGNSYPDGLIVYNNKLYFSADDGGTTGTELWSYDGINPPTIAADINLGNASSSPKYMMIYNGNLIFNATTLIDGQELWSYNGTTASLVADIYSGMNGSWPNNSDPRSFMIHNNELIFRAKDINGRELWKWDGTNTPEMVSDFNVGSNDSSPSWDLSRKTTIVELNGELILGADNGSIGEELYKVEICSIDNSVLVNNNVISANNTSATSYKWIDCNNNNGLIPNETSNTFTPSSNGSYAMIITNGNCIDTSDCVTISTIGLSEINSRTVLIYPNPASNVINIQSDLEIELIQIFDNNGRMVKQSNETKFSIENLSTGIYQIQVKNSAGTFNQRLIKQ